MRVIDKSQLLVNTLVNEASRRLDSLRYRRELCTSCP